MAGKYKEADALKSIADQFAALSKNIEKSISGAVKIIDASKGAVVVFADGGMLAAADKTAAGLRMAGKTAFVIEADAAVNGEIACVSGKDAAIIISGGGEKEKLAEVARLLKMAKTPVIAITPAPRGTIAKNADATIPALSAIDGDDSALSSTSCCSAMLIGGLICHRLLAKSGAAGLAGRALAGNDKRTVGNIISGQAKAPSVPGETSFRDALVELTSKGLGAISVTDDSGRLSGIITDGDVRRLLQKSQGSLTRIFLTNVESVMTKNPRRVSVNTSLSEAIEIMESHAITVLPVIDKSSKPIGMIHLHDLVQRGAMGMSGGKDSGAGKKSKK